MKNLHLTGFSLIELLISILVLSFGMLGAMKLQLNSMQSAQQSYFHSTALELATEVAERMRGVPQASLQDIDFQSGQNNAAFSYHCFSSGCASDQLAHAELVEWMQRVDAVLPNARAVICRDSSSRLSWECASADDNASVVIKLGWAEQQNDANPLPRLALAVTPY